MSDEEKESVYKRFFWLLASVAVTALGMGAYQVVTMEQTVKHMAETLREMKDSLSAVQAQVHSVTTTGAIVAEQVRINQSQQEQITELRIWQAEMKARTAGRP